MLYSEMTIEQLRAENHRLTKQRSDILQNQRRLNTVLTEKLRAVKAKRELGKLSKDARELLTQELSVQGIASQGRMGRIGRG